MQEESSGIEETVQTESGSLPENDVRPVEPDVAEEKIVSAENGDGEKKSPASKKKTPKKKKPSIPTVEAVVASENGESLPESEVVEGSDKSAGDKPLVEESVQDKPSDEKSVDEKSVDEKSSEIEETVQDKKIDGENKSLPEENESELSDEEKAEIERRRSEMNLDNETALLETVLFLESEPQPVETLSKITQLAPDVVEDCVQRLKDKYANTDSGIELSQIIGGWILTPKKECFDLVKERYGKKNEGRLSKAAIETLSIIAYSQPITRAEIESIRHVSADNMMRVLLDRKFIKEVGKKDIPGKPVTYGTTKEFLEFFHLQSIADLPQLDEKESERFELAR